MSCKKKLYNCDGQLSFFDLDMFKLEHETQEETIEKLRHGDVYQYRTKTIKAGNMLECEIFPIWKLQEARRAKEKQPSRKAQENLNHKNTKKKIMRLTNENFTSSDIWGTFGYDFENLPESARAARRDLTNFFNRIKRRRKKLGLPTLRYLYVTEWKHDGEDVRCHHHIIMSGDLSRDEVEKLWKGGAYPQTRRLRVKHDSGLKGLASYLAKGSRFEKMWNHSTNLKYPIPTVADKKITPRQATKIAVNENTAPALFEKLYKGYVFKDIEVKHSDYVAGVYIYVQMYKRN
ncbi:MAG: hypothetical protein LBC82_01340 [Oscillospiraceae bacterium]|jgi:hypothetical protein|nr:hypothetical protein [Oscillospiraceae bacterium]